YVCQRRQRSLEQRDGVAHGATLVGRAPRPSEILHRLVPHLGVLEVDTEAAVVALDPSRTLQRLADTTMEQATARTEQARVGDVADALMGERERLANLVEDAAAHELLQGARRARFSEVTGTLEKGEPEFASHRGCDGNQVLGILGQPLQPLVDESPH